MRLYCEHIGGSFPSVNMHWRTQDDDAAGSADHDDDDDDGDHAHDHDWVWSYPIINVTWVQIPFSKPSPFSFLFAYTWWWKSKYLSILLLLNHVVQRLLCRRRRVFPTGTKCLVFFFSQKFNFSNWNKKVVFLLTQLSFWLIHTLFFLLPSLVTNRYLQTMTRTQKRVSLSFCNVFSFCLNLNIFLLKLQCFLCWFKFRYISVEIEMHLTQQTTNTLEHLTDCLVNWHLRLFQFL